MQNQKITIEVIESKEFHIAARGYNQHEVDEFLDSICDELENTEQEIAGLKAEIERLRRPVPHQPTEPQPVVTASAGSADGTFREILEMAQRVKEQTIADAEAKAAEIVANAENEVKARLGSLNAEKQAMEAELEAMKTVLQDYKAKFEDVLAYAHEALNAACEL